jgi:hypothetical protein
MPSGTQDVEAAYRINHQIVLLNAYELGHDLHGNIS